MADIRSNIGGLGGGKYLPRTSGSQMGVQLNTFGLKKLSAALTGKALARMAAIALTPAEEEARAEWPIATGASRDSIHIEEIEVTEKSCRVALVVGGEQLINDPRNKSKRDYAPFIEFNGTPNAPAGILTRAVLTNDPAGAMHEQVTAFIAETLR